MRRGGRVAIRLVLGADDIIHSWDCSIILIVDARVISEKIRRMAAANERAARVILAVPARYGGEQALAVQWARRVMAKVEQARAA
jgi:hypothetical protein